MEASPTCVPNDMRRAEKGMIIMPIIMEVMALRFFISEVTKLTARKTTSGLTLAYHPGEAVSPIMRITYLGIVAYI